MMGVVQTRYKQGIRKPTQCKLKQLPGSSHGTSMLTVAFYMSGCRGFLLLLLYALHVTIYG